jgi:hypothetical protein
MFALFCVRALTSFSYYITILGWYGEGGRHGVGRLGCAR